jgi:hypothetical protein
MDATRRGQIRIRLFTPPATEIPTAIQSDARGTMTNETRALIEAAEEYMNGSDSGLNFSERVERRRPLAAAISSAKAAEEGVETTEPPSPIRQMAGCMKDYTGGRRLKDYLAEVREKEGL